MIKYPDNHGNPPMENISPISIPFSPVTHPPMASGEKNAFLKLFLQVATMASLEEKFRIF